MPQEISGSDQRSIHVAAKEVLQRPYWTRRPKSDGSFGVRGDIVRALIDENLAAHFEGMFTPKNGDHIAELIHTVGAYGLRPAQA